MHLFIKWAHSSSVDADVLFDSEYPEDGLVIDSYSRIEIVMELYVKSDSEIKIDDSCLECFQWLARNDSLGEDAYASLNALYGYEHETITFYNLQTGSTIIDGVVFDVYSSYLLSASVRTQNGGHCPDDTKLERHLFEPGNKYHIKLQLVAVDHSLSAESESIWVRTLPPPSMDVDSECEVHSVGDSTELFHEYLLNCTSTDSGTMYNALYSNIPFSAQFVSVSAPMAIPLAMGRGNGDAVITVLLEDSSSMRSCHDLLVPLPLIADANMTDLGQEMEDIIRFDDLSNAMDVVSLFTAIRGIFSCKLNGSACFEASVYKSYRARTNELFEALFQSSPVLAAGRAISSLDEVMAEISAFIAGTSADAYIGLDALEMLTYTYPAAVSQAVTAYIHHRHDDEDGDGDEGEEDLLALAVEMNVLIHNLESYVSALVADSAYIDLLEEALVQDRLHTAYMAVIGAFPGEMLRVSVDAHKVVIGKRVELHDAANGTLRCQDVILPNEVWVDHVDALSVCSVLYDDSSNLVSVNLYGADDHQPMNGNYGGNRCDPYLIPVAVPVAVDGGDYVLGQESTFPVCSMWNQSEGVWSSEECFVYALDEEQRAVICGCTQIGTHRVEMDVFVPRLLPQAQSQSQVQTESASLNLTVWVTVGVLVAALAAIASVDGILCSHNQSKSKSKSKSKNSNRPILAYEDVIFMKTRDERMQHDIAGKEIKYIRQCLSNEAVCGRGMAPLCSHKKALCTLSWSLFTVYLLDQHVLLSLLAPPSGSNLSRRSRMDTVDMTATPWRCCHDETN